MIVQYRLPLGQTYAIAYFKLIQTDSYIYSGVISRTPTITTVWSGGKRCDGVSGMSLTMRVAAAQL